MAALKNLPKYLAIDKLHNLLKIIKHNGGIIRSCYVLFVTDGLKWGELVGEDKYGNKYYENPYYFQSRSRWVDYNPKTFLDYDGSQIPAEWHGWMHHRTDVLPFNEASRPHYRWMLDHTENYSGTIGAFYPYSTTTPKIEAWRPPKKKGPNQ